MAKNIKVKAKPKVKVTRPKTKANFKKTFEYQKFKEQKRQHARNYKLKKIGKAGITKNELDLAKTKAKIQGRNIDIANIMTGLSGNLAAYTATRKSSRATSNTSTNNNGSNFTDQDMASGGANNNSFNTRPDSDDEVNMS